MVHTHWLCGALVATLMLTGCGGGSDGASTDAADALPKATKGIELASSDDAITKAATAATAASVASAPLSMRLTVENGRPVIQGATGVFDVMEDPDSSGPLPERRIMSAVSGPTIALPPATELRQVMDAQWRLVECKLVPKITYRTSGWVQVPVVTYQRESVCSGSPITARLDAPSIAQAINGSLTPIATSADGTRTAFQETRDGGCKQVHVIDTRGQRDVVTHIDLSAIGACNATRISLAVAGDSGVLAIGLPDALDAQGQPTGAVHVVGLPNGGWQSLARLTATTPTAGDAFGFTMAFSATGGRLLVGAPGAAGSSGQAAGTAFLFRTAANNTQWSLDHVFQGLAGARLGSNVAINAAGDHVTFLVSVTPPTYCRQLTTVTARSNCILDSQVHDYAEVEGVWLRQWRSATNYFLEVQQLAESLNPSPPTSAPSNWSELTEETFRGIYYKFH